ncbi:hypothetical protein GWD52_14140 [Enterobacteriaceae bacterium 4M9]|nr:hypothetical protein [Enterobacteriaceae bacterium 4M9]
MSNLFLIDNRFLFTIKNNRIEDITNGNYITLITPAARCLETLLLNRRLVTHQELYSSGWGDSAKEPAPSSLYQNILIIRKAFKELTNTDIDYITTVPRKGFIFKEDAFVGITENENDILPAPDIDNKQTPELTSSFTRIKLSCKSKALFFLNCALIISALALLVAIFTKIPAESQEKIFSERFVLFKEINKCNFHIEKKASVSFLNNKTTTPSLQKLWDIASSENGVPCVTYPWRYVALFEHENRARVLACTRPGDNDRAQECITIYLRNS